MPIEGRQPQTLAERQLRTVAKVKGKFGLSTTLASHGVSIMITKTWSRPGSPFADAS